MAPGRHPSSQLGVLDGSRAKKAEAALRVNVWTKRPEGACCRLAPEATSIQAHFPTELFIGRARPVQAAPGLIHHGPRTTELLPSC